jgi:hypothetical protein
VSILDQWFVNGTHYARTRYHSPDASVAWLFRLCSHYDSEILNDVNLVEIGSCPHFGKSWLCRCLCLFWEQEHILEQPAENA